MNSMFREYKLPQWFIGNLQMEQFKLDVTKHINDLYNEKIKNNETLKANKCFLNKNCSQKLIYDRILDSSTLHGCRSLRVIHMKY